MTVTADDAFRALVAWLFRFASAHPVAWTRYENGVVAVFTGVPVPDFNGVIAEHDKADVEFASRMLDEIEAAGVPYSVAVRSDKCGSFIELAKSRRLTESGNEPLMVVEASTIDVNEEPPERLSIRELAPSEFDDHLQVLARCFGTPIEIARMMMTEEMFRLDGVRAYLGEFEDVPVATAVGVTEGTAVGVFNVGTLEEWRGKGFGRALTTRVIADGYADGAKWSYLQSSPSGLPVYRRLGFETVEQWSRYVSAVPVNQ
jgi:N-acetylglutamate synthase